MGNSLLLSSDPKNNGKNVLLPLPQTRLLCQPHCSECTGLTFPFVLPSMEVAIGLIDNLSLYATASVGVFVCKSKKRDYDLIY